MEMKKCNKCWIEKPATTEFFYTKKTNKNGLFSICKECTLKQQYKYYEENKAKCKNAHKKYYEQNKEKCRNDTKKWNKENNERKQLKQKEWELLHPGNSASRTRKWAHQNKEKVNLKTQRRVTRIKNTMNLYLYKDWEECKAYFNNECAYCGKKEKLTQDHVIPTKLGGGYVKSNIVPACRSCNSSKHYKDMSIWYKKKDYFNIDRYNKILKWVNINNNIQQLSIL